jgi:hypothetical protein
MKRLALSIALFTACVAAAQEQGSDLPNTVKDEIARRGYMVEEIDQNIRDEGTLAVGEAIGIHEDDSHKWFLTIIEADFKCPPCDQLKRDLMNAEVLQKWVRLEERKDKRLYSTEDSFLHVNFEFLKNPWKPDRWKGIDVKGYPTVLIQPPLNGKWGPPTTVVNQRTGYDGKPEGLEKFIRESIVKYCRKYAETREYREARDLPFRTSGLAGPRSGARQNPAEIGQTGPLPFPIPDPDRVGPHVPYVQPVDRYPVDPGPSPTNPPVPSPVSGWAGTILAFLLGSGAGGVLVGIVMALLQAYVKTTPSTVDDKIVAVIAQLLQKQPQPPPPVEAPVPGAKPILQITPEILQKIMAQQPQQQA